MNNRNPYTLKLILMIIFSFFMVFVFVYFSSNKNMNIEANDIYIHKLTIGNTCISSYIEKLKFENIKITYNTLEVLENKCK